MRRVCLILPLVGLATSCAVPASLTMTGRVGTVTSLQTNTFVRQVARNFQASTGPILYYRGYNGDTPQVTPDMTITFMPDRGGTDLYLYSQCNTNGGIRVTDNNADVGIGSDGHFFLTNHPGQGVHEIVVTADCGDGATWAMKFYTRSSPPYIPRW